MASKSSKTIAIVALITQFLALLSLAASVILLATNNYTLTSDNSKTHFYDVITFRYVFATGVIAFIYVLIQIPFTIYLVCTGKRMIRNRCLPEFDYYGDKLISLLLASGVGAGLAVTLEFKSLLDGFIEILAIAGLEGVDEFKSKSSSFLNRAIISTAILSFSLLCMIILSLISRPFYARK
ncbi:CASP-like protein 4D1 [Impatiens glandulifera]|uniref:CASP-like protein 4D1 n=1 Tax=Impatiens glandulifera TaxID=253017 RepID=UPI001FB0C63D|nr:CASP-like protein 4D1 [Impatiens glandulifera]